MAEPETYLKTQQVADALQVSVSTIKRWVDSGSLIATRTLGKHRLIPLSGAIRLAEELRLPLAGLRRLEALPSQESVSVLFDDAARQALIDDLKAGRVAEVRARVQATPRTVQGVVALADDLVRPVLERIGHAWMVGAWDIHEEHQASLILISAINELLGRFPTNLGTADAPLAIGATPEGDFYQLPNLLGELVLRALGWDVRNLGPNLPLSSLSKAVSDYRPNLVFLSVSHLSDPARFLRDYQGFHENTSQFEAAVILGGRALGPELRAKLVYAGFGERMAHLAEFARRVRPAPSTSNKPNVMTEHASSASSFILERNA